MILDDDELHRRLAPGWVDDTGRVASVAFKRAGQPENDISVDLARITTTAATLASRPNFGIGMLKAIEARSLSFEVFHDPQPENHAHSLIRGDNSKEKCRLLAERTLVIILPRGETG